MRRTAAIVCLWLMAAVCQAGDVVFTNADFQNRPQQVRSVDVFFLDAPAAAVTNNTTRDWVTFKTDQTGYFIITNYFPGNYRFEFRGTKTTTTNWYEFPATNGTINGNDPEWGRGPTNGVPLALTSRAGDLRYLRIPTNAGALGQVPSWTSSNSTRWVASSPSGFLGDGNQFLGTAITSIKSGVILTNINQWGTLNLFTATGSGPTVQLDGGGGNITAGGLDASGSVTAASFAGDGSLITGLNASALASGTIPRARLGNTITNAGVIFVYANGAAWGPNGPINTAGTTTSGIEEAWNVINTGADLLHPAGGKIYLADTAPYYTSSGILLSNYYCGDVEISGPGLMAGGVVRTTPGPVFKVTSARLAPDVTTPVCPMALHLHDMFIASATNTAGTNLIEVDDFARLEIDHNWIGYWSAMTNNNQPLNKVGFSTCTFGWGVSNTALIGISIRGVSDLAEIHGNSFLGLAASAYLGSDHMRVWNNFSSFVGVSNAVPNTSPFSLGAAWVVQPDMSHNDLYISGQFMYNCQAGYFLFSTNAAGSYNYNTVLAFDDSYEATPTNVLLTANLRMAQRDPAFLRASANNNALVSTYPTFSVQNGRIENDRVQLITTRTNRMNLAGSDLVLGNGRAGILNTAATLTNSFYLYSCGLTAANGIYTNPIDGGPDGPGVGEVVYTNGTTGYYLLYDRDNNVLPAQTHIGIYNTSDDLKYGFSGSVDDPLIYQATSLGGVFHGTAPIGQLQPVFSGIRTIFTGDGSGLTNLPSGGGGGYTALNSTQFSTNQTANQLDFKSAAIVTNLICNSNLFIRGGSASPDYGQPWLVFTNVSQGNVDMVGNSSSGALFAGLGAGVSFASASGGGQAFVSSLIGTRGELPSCVFGTGNWGPSFTDGGAFIGGGWLNGITNNSTMSGILAGKNNGISNAVATSVILGGTTNLIGGVNALSNAIVLGGDNNQAGATLSLAAGHRAKALQTGTFVWADSQAADFSSQVADGFNVRAQGGVRFELSSATFTNNGKFTNSGVVNVGGATMLGAALNVAGDANLTNTIGVAGNAIFGAGLTNTSTAGITYNALKSPTNSAAAPDFRLGNAETNVSSGTYAMLKPINIDTTALYGQTTVFIIRTNGGYAGLTTVSAPDASVHLTGNPICTNTMAVTVFVYGKEFTNYNCNPLY